MDSLSPKAASGHSFWLGFLIAPASGLLLFVLAFLLVHYTQYRGNETGFTQGIALSFIVLLTYGLVAIYLFAGIVGLPTAYLLQRKSALNLLTVNFAALGWTVVILTSFRLLALSANASAPIASEVVSVLQVTFLFAPFVVFAATIFCWFVQQDRAVQFGLKHVLMLVTTVCAALSVAVVIRSALEPRVVASVVHPNGTRLVVTQEFGMIGEPFVTEIYFDDGGGSWKWYYYDHEDSYWGNADCAIVGSDIRVSSPGKRSIQLDTTTGECSVSNAEGRIRSYRKSTQIDTLPPTLGSLLDTQAQMRDKTKLHRE